MAEYINREDAYRYLSRYYHHSTYVQSLYLREVLDGIPAADVVGRKTGKWILPNNEVAVYLNEWICSACNNLIDGKHNYCPNCGAQMIGGDEDV